MCYVSLISLLCLSILLAFRVKKEILSSTKLNIVHEYKVFLPTKQRLQFIQCKWRIVTKFYCSWIWKALAYLWGLSNSVLCLLGFSFSPNPFFFFFFFFFSFFFLRYVIMRFTYFTIWVKTGLYRPSLYKLKHWPMTKQTNKQDTILTPFENQMLHCLVLMDYSLNLVWFFMGLRVICYILSSNF